MSAPPANCDVVFASRSGEPIVGYRKMWLRIAKLDDLEQAGLLLNRVRAVIRHLGDYGSGPRLDGRGDRRESCDAVRVTNNGVAIYYRTEGSAEPLILQHGFTTAAKAGMNSVTSRR